MISIRRIGRSGCGRRRPRAPAGEWCPTRRWRAGCWRPTWCTVGRSRGARGALFVSESPRNRGAGVSPWTWSKVVRSIALRAGVPAFSTHTLRHLCLTDLARSGWELHQIATFAGHRSTDTTQRYIHLSGRDLAERLTSGMSQIHQARVAQLGEVLA